jgi:NTE family protein
LADPARRRNRRQLLTGRRLIWLICSALIVLHSPNATADEALPQRAARPKVGLALSGGGARGAAHIGVLKVLEEHRVPVDYIAGTSMGAIVGGLYASGMSAGELEALISHIDWTAAFADKIPRENRSFRRKRDDDLYLVKNKPGISGFTLKFPPGILDGQKIDLLLKKYTLPVIDIRNFDDLSIPFRAIATDLVTGRTIVIDHGDLALALRASMSIPLIFAPREIDGRLLADGGVSCNLPIDVVRRMGADVVIAVDISTPLLEREELQSGLAIADQLTGIMTRRNTDLQIASLTNRDVFIHPDLGAITTASFDHAAEAIPSGITAARADLGELAPLSVPAEEYGAYLASRTRHGARPVIDEIRIINQSRLADGVITSRLNVETGKSLDVDRLENGLDQIYGLELFESVYYDVTAEADRNVLTITARERAWGPNYIQLGLAIFEDFEGPNFNLAAAYTRTAVNRLNGEWRTGLQIGQEPGVYSEFYQPLDPGLRFFLHLRASADEQAESVFDAGGNKLSELNLRRYGIELAGGRELGTWAEIRAGIIRDAGSIKVQIGDPSEQEADFNTGELFLQLFADELDDVNFPRSGGSLRSRITAGLKDVGSDDDYEQATIDGSYALTKGRYTGLLSESFATTRSSDSPYQSQFRLGGFGRLSGFEQNELKGQHAALLSGTFYRRMGDSSLLSVYVGLSLEYGNVYQKRSEIKFANGIAAGSVFLGLNTLIGPVYLAYGFAERGRQNYYLFLGRSL